MNAATVEDNGIVDATLGTYLRANVNRSTMVPSDNESLMKSAFSLL